VGNDFGRAQYVLLQAIPRQRLSSKAKSLLRQWDRKFRLFPLYSGPRSQGGWVTSPIPRDALPQVTDKQWLEIIKRDWSKQGFRWKQMGADLVGEANHEHFARDMREMARWQPQRFAELAPRIPKEAYSGYLDAILSALDPTEPPKPQTKSGKPPKWQSTLSALWEPATGHQIEAVLDYVGFSDDRDQAISYCRLIERRVDANWSPRALKRLIRYATEHPNPAAEKFPFTSTEANGKVKTNILTSAINCVRGCAAEAIHRLLFLRPELLHTFLSAIQHLVRDESPAVRVAAIGVCLPVLNIDRDMAVDLFAHACKIDDDRIFEARYANNFIAYARHSHLDRLEPIIERMMRSDNQKVASYGAAWATGTWLQTGRLESWMSACKSGTVPQRKGVADVASHWISEEDKDFTQKCVTLLKRFFNDDSSKVRDKAASVFHGADIFHRSEMIPLSQWFVDTRAFDDDPGRIFSGLESYTGNLRSYAETLLKACKKLSGSLAEASRDFSGHIAGCTMELSSLMLRLYEQSQDSGDRELQTKCLDAWDMIIRSRVGGLYGVLEKIDS
ncbi:MAG: adaptin domain-containing protein, partial [Desulfobacteraceae bacterium]|nr:adaptin domain-containing protein [Desulfobacteraceae bacterium]